MDTESIDDLPYVGKLRVRSSGILIQDDKILLVNHRGIGSNGNFWSPPGGGVKFRESLRQTVARELKEETGITVKVGKLVASNEFISDQLHAIEFFYSVHHADGKVSKGYDPEFSEKNQIILDVQWMDISSLNKIPDHAKHGILMGLKTLKQLTLISGFLEFPQNSSQ